MSEFVTILREEQRVPKHDDIAKTILREAADRIEALEAEVERLTEAARLAQMQSDQAVRVADEGIAEVERLTAERDGLAKALRELADLALSVERVPLLVQARSDALRAAARAALAALPPEEDDRA